MLLACLELSQVAIERKLVRKTMSADTGTPVVQDHWSNNDVNHHENAFLEELGMCKLVRKTMSADTGTPVHEIH